MKRQKFVLCGALITALLRLPSAALADQASAITTQPDSPVHITACYSKTGHVKGTWGTESDTLHLSVNFSNVSDKAISAVLIGFELQNQFGDVLGQATTQATGNFSPQVSIDDQHWDGENQWPGFSVLVCSVKRALFSDGQIWRATAPTSGGS